MACRKVNLIWREKWLWSNSWMQIYNALPRRPLRSPPFFFPLRPPVYQTQTEAYRGGKGHGSYLKKCFFWFRTLTHFLHLQEYLSVCSEAMENRTRSGSHCKRVHQKALKNRLWMEWLWETGHNLKDFFDFFASTHATFFGGWEFSVCPIVVFFVPANISGTWTEIVGIVWHILFLAHSLALKDKLDWLSPSLLLNFHGRWLKIVRVAVNNRSGIDVSVSNL